MDELYHHGIDGQQWGVRNGPPYPLDSETHNGVIEKVKAKREADKAARKEEKHKKLVASADAKTVEKYARKGEFTTEELNAIYNRLGVEKKIAEVKNYNAQEVLRNMSSSLDVIAKTAVSGSQVWNVIANIHNAKADDDHQWAVLGQRISQATIAKQKSDAEDAANKARKSKIEADIREQTSANEILNTNAKNAAQYYDQKDKAEQQKYEYNVNSAIRTALNAALSDVNFGDSDTYSIPEDYWSNAWANSTSGNNKNKNKQGK